MDPAATPQHATAPGPSLRAALRVAQLSLSRSLDAGRLLALGAVPSVGERHAWASAVRASADTLLAPAK